MLTQVGRENTLHAVLSVNLGLAGVAKLRRDQRSRWDEWSEKGAAGTEVVDGR